MDNLEGIGKRLSKYLKDNDIGLNELGRMSNTSGAQVSNIINGKVYGFDKLLKIINVLPELDLNYLIYGDENMQGNLQGFVQGFQEKSNEMTQILSVNEPTDAYQKEKKGIPVYEVIATAGKIDVFNDIAPIPSEYIFIPGFQDCNGALKIYGDSMYPLYNNGDYIIYRKVNDKSLINYGKPYLIVTSEYRTVKYIFNSKKSGFLRLKSENSFYEPFDLETDKILELYLIKGCIKRSEI
jgi:hypothetical protein